MEFDKFETRAPSPQNAIDIFKGRWASSFGEMIPGVKAGDALHFTRAPGPALLAKNFSKNNSDLAGYRILELGPLEGGHTYALEQLNPDEIVAVEANAEAFLKCLISKELLGMKRSKFLFGDFNEYMQGCAEKFDIIFASGVLYHMPDPLRTLRLMSDLAPRAYVWTHYHVPGDKRGLKPMTVEREGEHFVYNTRVYRKRTSGRLWGGNKATAAFLSRDDLLRAFRVVGFANIEVHAEDPMHENGPCIAFSAWK